LSSLLFIVREILKRPRAAVHIPGPPLPPLAPNFLRCGPSFFPITLGPIMTAPPADIGGLTPGVEANARARAFGAPGIATPTVGGGIALGEFSGLGPRPVGFCGFAIGVLLRLGDDPIPGIMDFFAIGRFLLFLRDWQVIQTASRHLCQ